MRSWGIADAPDASNVAALHWHLPELKIRRKDNSKYLLGLGCSNLLVRCVAAWLRADKGTDLRQLENSK